MTDRRLDYPETTDWELERMYAKADQDLAKERKIVKILKGEGLYLGWNKENCQNRIDYLTRQKARVKAELAYRQGN